MARKPKVRIETEKSSGEVSASPFESLSGLETTLPPKPVPSAPTTSVNPARPQSAAQKTTGMRLDVRRETSGRGGKTVTTIHGVAPLGDTRRSRLLRELKNHCGSGGTDRRTSIEIQGDHRETVIEFLRKNGFRPVAAGG